MTHKQKVINYCREHGSITPAEAFYHLGVSRLAAVVFELKKDGYTVDAKKEGAKNRDGNQVYYARYYIREG